MKNHNFILPSNKKFGVFFSTLFLILSTYFYISNNIMLTYIFVLLCVVLLGVCIIKAELLLPFNKLWLRFGLLLGMIVSPIVIGGIFFLIFTPIGFFMRLFGRDELILKQKKKKSYWVIVPKESLTNTNFRNQF